VAGAATDSARSEGEADPSRPAVPLKGIAGPSEVSADGATGRMTKVKAEEVVTVWLQGNLEANILVAAVCLSGHVVPGSIAALGGGDGWLLHLPSDADQDCENRTAEGLE